MTKPADDKTSLTELVIIFAAIAMLVLCCVSGLFGDSPPPIGWTTPAHFVRVIDGDTLEVEIRRRVTVRLLDCWTPESRTRDAFEKRLGLEAKANLETITDGQPLTLHIPADAGSDLSDLFTFGRVVGTVWTAADADRSINQRQIDDGFGWPTKQTQKAAVEHLRKMDAVGNVPPRPPKPRKAEE